MGFEPLQGWGLPHCPGQPVPVPDHSASKDIFPNIQSKPPLTQLEAISLHPTMSYLGEETNKGPLSAKDLCSVKHRLIFHPWQAKNKLTTSNTA